MTTSDTNEEQTRLGSQGMMLPNGVMVEASDNTLLSSKEDDEILKEKLFPKSKGVITCCHQ